MRIVCSYRGRETTWEVNKNEFVLGRTHESSYSLVDLSADKKISRLHAKVWTENSALWIEDLRSAHGTLLNDLEIKGMGRQRINAGAIVVIGETTLRFETFESQDPRTQTNYLEIGSNLSDAPQREIDTRIARDLDATNFDPGPSQGSGECENFRLKLICELPLQFAAKTKLHELLPIIVERLAELISNADSWALALRDPQTNALLLKAYRSQRQLHLSETLSRRAMEERKAFIWNRTAAGDISSTVLQSPVMTGMYAPLLWQGEAFGVICVECSNLQNVFTDEDLRFMVFMAQYAAMAVGSHRLQERLREESVVSAKLLRQFSPQIAGRLLSHRGRLRLGGERSEVTIVNSDIRGFTQLTAEMEPDDVVEMVNDYFASLVPIIFAHQGTVDKFMGDAILAVFGSPEPDHEQYQHAVLAAMEMQVAMAKMNQLRRSRDLPCAEAGIGIHCGEVVHGFVGTSDRMEFTVIGDTVNKSSRYCAAAGKGEVLISPEVHERVWRIVEVEQRTIPTKHEGSLLAYHVTRVKSVVGPKPDETPQ